MKTTKEENAIEENCETNIHETKDRTFFGVPYPTVYLFIISLMCPFCHTRGRPKTFKNLWRLRMHFVAHHSADSTRQQCRNTIGELVDYIRLHQKLIEQGVLR